jgi:ubiquinone/menaquinone biosynthesis C-methylase UbiE
VKRLHSILLTLLIGVLALGSVVTAQQQRSAEEYIKLLESERRIEGLQVQRVVEALNVKPGQRICDLGAGSGLFTRPLAQAVGSQGVVYAVDIDPALLKHVEKTAQEQKLANIKTVLAGADDPKLPEPVDLIAIIDTLHHIGNQPTYLKNLRRYLRPNGRIAVIDFSKTWPAGHEKMIYKLEDLNGWMQAAGLKLITQHYFLDNDFFVVYQPD